MTGGPTPVLSLSEVSVRIDGSVILDRIDWTLHPGHRWVVLGPNGAGKTTLLQLAALHRHPSEGTVEVLGHRLGEVDVRALRRRIGLVSPAVTDLLRPTMAAADLVVSAIHGALVPWWLHVTREDRDRAAALLERFGVGDLADRPFGTLSSGERQRVLLARALVTEPDLVLLDEPMAGLDLGAREALVTDLGELAAEPASPPIALVTHHLEEIPTGFTHGLLLRDGRILAEGRLEDAVDDEGVSAAFAVDLTVSRVDGRWRAIASTSRRSGPGRPDGD